MEDYLKHWFFLWLINVEDFFDNIARVYEKIIIITVIWSKVRDHVKLTVTDNEIKQYTVISLSETFSFIQTSEKYVNARKLCKCNISQVYIWFLPNDTFDLFTKLKGTWNRLYTWFIITTIKHNYESEFFFQYKNMVIKNICSGKTN